MQAANFYVIVVVLKSLSFGKFAVLLLSNYRKEYHEALKWVQDDAEIKEIYSSKYNKQDTTLHNILYYCQCSTCFGRFLCPSS